MGSRGVHNAIGRVGSGQEVFKISRIGSGRVKRYSNIADRVRSGLRVVRISQAGSGQDFFKSYGSG